MSSSRLRRPARTLLAGLGLAAVVIAPTTATIGVTAASAADEGDTVTLMNINDFHGRIDSTAIPLACTLSDQRAAAGANSVFLSAGDNYGASEFSSFVFDEQPTIEYLNALDLKASALGNHEYDQGKEGLAKKQTSENWTYLGANVLSDDPAYQPDSFTIVKAGDVKVAVVGADTQETPSLTSPEGLQGISFQDPVSSVNKAVKELKKNHEGEYDLIVAEYHDGSTSSADPGEAPNSTKKFDGIVENTSADVDVIFTGHTHMSYDYEAPVPGKKGETRPIIQTGSYGDNLGVVPLVRDGQGNWSLTEDGASLVSTEKAIADPAEEDDPSTVKTTCDQNPRADYTAARKVADDAIEKAAIEGAKPVGSISGDITTGWAPGDAKYEDGTWKKVAAKDKGDDRNRPSALSNELADSMVWDTQQGRGGAKADIGVMNPGGVRADLWKAPIKNEADGVVTFGEANNVVPFVNNLDTIDLTGAQVVDLVEQQWQPDNPKGDQWLGLSKNVTYNYVVNDTDGKKTGEISQMYIDGKPIDPEKTYTVVAANFLVGGGDNFTAFSKGTNRADTGRIDRDAWIDYLKSHKDLAPDFSPRGIEVEYLHPRARAAEGTTTIRVQDVHSLSIGAPQVASVRLSLDGKTYEAPYKKAKDGTWAAEIPLDAPADGCVPADEITSTMTVQAEGDGVVSEDSRYEIPRDGDLPEKCSEDTTPTPTDPPTSTDPAEPSNPSEPGEPSEPSESSDPSEPSEPSEPSGPSEPSEPSEDTGAGATATADDAGDLAHTGATVAPYAIAAGALILVGVSILAIRRRLGRH